MKQIFSILLIMAMLLGFGCLSVAAEQHVPLFGDATGDRDINAADALKVLQCAVGKQEILPSEMCYMDVNTDYKVDAADALLILKKAVGKLDKFAPDDGFDDGITIAYPKLQMQYGCTALTAVQFFASRAEYNVHVTYNQDLLDVSWNQTWLGEDSNIQVLHLYAKGKPQSVIETKLFVYYKDHPGLYLPITVECFPASADVLTNYNFSSNVVDLGDYANVLPCFSEVTVSGQNEIIDLYYAVADLDAHAATGTNLDDYKALLSRSLTSQGNQTYTNSNGQEISISHRSLSNFGEVVNIRITQKQ